MSESNGTLVVNKRLQKVLPALTREESKQLKANLIADGRVLDPILYAAIDGVDTVVDGMNRYPVAIEHELPHDTRLLPGITTFDEAELWILEHQLGRRNLMDPDAFRKIVGELYNARKKPVGRPPADENNGAEFAPLPKLTCETLSEEVGISPRAVKSAGAYASALAKLSDPVRRAVETKELDGTDSEIKVLANLEPGEQKAVAREVRTGQQSSLKDALVARGKIKAKAAKAENEDADPPPEVAKADQITTQRQKTVKTVEALQRAFDDLQGLLPKPEHAKAVTTCKELLRMARGWK